MAVRINIKNVTNFRGLLNLFDKVVKGLNDLTTLINELRTDHASFRTFQVNSYTKHNELRTHLRQNQILGNPGFQIKTNFDIENANAFDYVQGGLVKTEAASQTWDTGTTASWAAAKWGIAALSITDAAATNVNWATNDAAGYDTEAAAIAAMPTVASNYTAVGYVTIQAHATNTWTAGTDALQGGTGGNVSQDTNYYNGGWDVRNIAAMTADYPATIAAGAVTIEVERGT